MFPSQIRLLHPSTPTPYASFRGRPIDDRVLVQDFIIGRHQEATSADNAVRGYSHGVMNARSCRDRVEVAHTRRFHTWRYTDMRPTFRGCAMRWERTAPDLE